MPSGRPRSAQTDTHTDPRTEKACPGEALPCGGSSTSLKWGCDGELSQLDRERILRRLAAADPMALTLHQPQLRQHSA